MTRVIAAVAALVLLGACASDEPDVAQPTTTTTAPAERCHRVDTTGWPVGPRADACVRIDDKGRVTTEIDYGDGTDLVCEDTSVDHEGQLEFVTNGYVFACGIPTAGELVPPAAPDDHPILCGAVNNSPNAPFGAVTASDVDDGVSGADIAKLAVICLRTRAGVWQRYEADRTSDECHPHDRGYLVCWTPRRDGPPASGTDWEAWCEESGDELACSRALADRRSDDYFETCFSEELAEYRDWLAEKGLLEQECPATP